MKKAISVFLALLLSLSISCCALAANINAQQAKEIALNHAGVDASKVQFIKCELDYDDGLAVFEIEFYADNIEYEYDINAASGKIIKAEKEYKSAPVAPQPAQPNSDYIGSERAKEIALNHAGATTSKAQFLECKMDYDDGFVIYEVDFYYNNCEFDYEIDAYSGKILKAETDQRDVFAKFAGILWFFVRLFAK